MDYLVLFLLGIACGSFLGVVIYRLRRGNSALRGRSYCDHCRRKIAWYDNIPLLSYCLLGGRCRRCRREIPLDYPLTELLIGIQFVWVYWLLKINFNFFNRVEGWYSLALLTYWLVLFAGSAAIAIYDFKHQLIPDQVLLPLIVVSGARLIVSSQWSVIPAAFGAASVLAAIHWLSRGRGMGWGDVKLGFLIGLVLGWPRAGVALFLAFLTGAVWGVILILAGRKRLKSKIAFGPFLLGAMLLAKIYGDQIWQWYANRVLP